ncbi:phosphotransferase [Schumannella sp. 10F1B-5-1]|uniref:phosphotransferase n=1 Tax=Schumannella sp. 10F1B-5-1 TaxID=2590780 RepID=UPI0011315211|nr:phosphotransferase [Schumannella sp. 10F1B-5-1]TPW73157.1 phosphotransferase [Schumannella sp. 10F1B-5-1]
MARTPLTLAALATSAVAGLDVVAASRIGAAGGDFDTALLSTRDERWFVVRVPRTEAAESRQSADLLALGALTAGTRSRLPFEVTTPAGQTPVDGTRAVVYEFVGGSKTPVSSLTADLAASIGQAIAAIHSLPTSCVTEVGLPSLGPVHAHQTSGALVAKAIETGLLPAALRERWEGALADDRLWQYQPTVINGDLGADTVLSHAEQVVGVLDWHELRVADPARDLAWLFSGRRSELAETAIAAYLQARPAADRQIGARASFYAELEIASWLLHGTQTRSTDIVDDAVRMLHGLVDDVQSQLGNQLGPPTAPVLAVTDVEQLLDGIEKDRVEKDRVEKAS